MVTWEFASATCIGSHHRKELSPTNGQDAYFTAYNPETGRGLMVVADGCGSTKYSEVGAQLGVRTLADLWAMGDRHVPGYQSLWWGGRTPLSDQFLERLIHPMVERLREVLTPLGHPDAPERLTDAVMNYGLFTLNGVIFDPDTMVFFCIGDGVVIINGEVVIVTPPDRGDAKLANAPQYLGYTVIDPTAPLQLSFYRVLPTKLVHSFVVASDGLGDLIAAEAKCLPGQPRVVGPINQLWTDDDYFTNPQRLQRLLALASVTKKKLVSVPNEPTRLETYPGLLSDDTTLVVGRKTTPSERS